MAVWKENARAYHDDGTRVYKRSTHKQIQRLAELHLRVIYSWESDFTKINLISHLFRLKLKSLRQSDNKMSYNVAMKTVFKMLDIPLDGKISREDFERYSKHEREGVKLLNPDEAERVYSGLMSISDVLGMDKYAKDGGMNYTLREFDIARRVASRKELPEANRVLHSAYFRAIDTNGDHFLERSEWTNCLKMCKTYTSEEQAMQSFDSIDKNKDGVISLEEYVEYAVDFWCSLREDHGALDLYGTKNL